MAKKKETKVPAKPVRLEVFDIQGHNGDQPLDYIAFFEVIAAQASKTRRETIANRIIAVPTFQYVDGLYFFTAYSGSSDTSFLVLDLDNDAEEVRHIEAGKMIATRTIGVIDPTNRRAAVQYVHTGVRSAQIATLFEKLAQLRSKDFEGATLELAPLAGRTFAEEIASFERIQSASVTLTRPNYDWDDFNTVANEMAGDSNAQNISITATASRGQTLLKERGLVQDILDLTRRAGRSIVKAATIKGFKNDETALTTLNLSKHIEAKNQMISLGSDGMPAPTLVLEAAVTLLNETPLAQPSLPAQSTATEP